MDLDCSNAEQYLGQRRPERGGWRITELGGGVSNTVLLAENGGCRLVLKQALGKLRVQEDWFSDRGRIFREAAAMRALASHLPAGAVPEVLFEDRENGIFAMTAAPPGSETWKSLLMAGDMQPGIARRAGAILAAMARASWRNAEWEARFGDQTVFDQLRLDPYYRTTASRHPGLSAHFERLMAASGERRVAIVHGDWSPKNFLVHNGLLTAIDFEVIHFGDPAFDSAFLLNHLLLKSFHRPEWRASLAALGNLFWTTYREGLPAGADWIESATLQHLGCLMLARIDGKSPVEYLKDENIRGSVRRFATSLILERPSAVAEVFAHVRHF